MWMMQKYIEAESVPEYVVVPWCNSLEENQKDTWAARAVSNSKWDLSSA